MNNSLGELIETIKARLKVLLIENRNFQPFGAYVKAGGDITYVSADQDENSMQEAYQFLLDSVKEELQDENIEVSVIVLNGVYDDFTTVVIEVFFTSQFKYQVVFPYVLCGGNLIYGEQI